MKIYHPSLAEITKDTPLNNAETVFMAKCKSGKLAKFGNGLPTKGTDTNTLRANLIRHAMLGGCEEMPVSPKGVRIEGAWVTDVLDLQNCDSPLDLFLSDCKINRRPMLRDARLGSVMLPGCTIPGLDAHRLTVVRSILLNQKFRSKGTVDISSARIGISLACNSGTFDGNGCTALDCNGMDVGGSVFLTDSFAATGLVDFIQARIAGQFNCRNGTFNNGGGIALNCDSTSVGGSVFLRNNFLAIGQVRFRGAQIDGQLSCVNGTFIGSGKKALECNGVKVGESVFLRGGFSATGQVNLLMAQIAGQLSCSDATFNGIGGTALNCNKISVGASILLHNNFIAKGRVCFVGARVSGDLSCSEASFRGRFDCERVLVGGVFIWQEVVTTPNVLDLTDAHVASLRDDKDSWQGCTPILHGFRYDRIISDMSVGQRLKWLARGYEPAIEPTLETEWNDLKGAKAFDPQPYSMLAKTLNAQGNASGAARVLVERGHRQARARYQAAQAALDGSLEAGWSAFYATLKRPVDAMFGLIFGYGHQPARALLMVFVILLACFNLYGAAYDAGQMAPNSDVVITSADWVAGVNAYDNCTKAPCEMPLRAWEQTPSYQDYETFNRGLYALDLFVPLDALGQENAWAPSKDRGALGWVAYYARWLVQLSGWVITAIGAAALTGVIGKRD